MSDTDHFAPTPAPTDTCPMRLDASRDAILCELGSCRAPFTPRKPWQRYCCSEHRIEANKLRDDGGLRGIVSSVRVLKRGQVSVVVRFGADERDQALGLEPGTVVEMLHEGLRAIERQQP